MSFSNSSSDNDQSNVPLNNDPYAITNDTTLSTNNNDNNNELSNSSDTTTTASLSHDELFLQRLKQQYSSPTLQAFRPAGWSILMTLCTGSTSVLSYIYKLPVYPSAIACGLFTYTYTCFRDGQPIIMNQNNNSNNNTPRIAIESSSNNNQSSSIASNSLTDKKFYSDLAHNNYKKREEGYLSGIGTSAIFGSLQFTAMRKHYENLRNIAYQTWLTTGEANNNNSSTSTTMANTKLTNQTIITNKLPPNLPSLRSTVFNPLAINILLLSSASAIYYSFMMQMDREN